jgi:hypothetical protein
MVRLDQASHRLVEPLNHDMKDSARQVLPVGQKYGFLTKSIA